MCVEKECITTKKNPVIPGRGVCDPHMHIFNDRVYLYATHDYSRDNKGYCMKDWQIWSSPDFITWELERTVRPEDFYMGASNGCWAVDAAYKNGKYYYYFSEQNRRTGVAVSDAPGGPFVDELRKPLLDGTLTPTPEYDPAVFTDEDGKSYIAFGGPSWAYGEGCGYFIAQLGEDMMSLAEEPRRLELNHEADDKVSLNKINGKYYLTFASYYAVSDSVYGPYLLMGNTGASADHGSYFEWNNQLFNAFTIFDPTMVSRSSGVCYVHVRDNGALEVDSLIVEYGVGQYDARWNKIEAEWYMKADGVRKAENPRSGFDVACTGEGSLSFPNIHHTEKDMQLSFFASCSSEKGGKIEVRENDESGRILGSCEIPCTGEINWRNYRMFICELSEGEAVKNLHLTLKVNGEGELRLDYFKFWK